MPHPAFLGPLSNTLLELASALTRAGAPVEVTTELTRLAWNLAGTGV